MAQTWTDMDRLGRTGTDILDELDNHMRHTENNQHKAEIKPHIIVRRVVQVEQINFVRFNYFLHRLCLTLFSFLLSKSFFISVKLL